MNDTTTIPEIKNKNRPYLFLVKGNTKEETLLITSLISSISFDAHHCYIEYLEDDNNTVFNFIGSSHCFEYCLLDNIGDVVESISFDIFNPFVALPPEVSHEKTGVIKNKVCIKYGNVVRIVGGKGFLEGN